VLKVSPWAGVALVLVVIAHPGCGGLPTAPRRAADPEAPNGQGNRPRGDAERRSERRPADDPVSVTDKRLDDQSQEVVSFARRTQSVMVVVAPEGSAAPGRTPPGPGPSPTPTPPPARLVITVVTNGGSMSYAPNPATARVGQRIVWVNADAVTHTATANGGAFDTGFLAPGETSAAVTLPAGTFPYRCGVHPSMVATLIVKP